MGRSMDYQQVRATLTVSATPSDWPNHS